MKSTKPLNPKLPGHYGRMTAKELDEEVAKLEREFIIEETAPLTPKLKARLKRARRRRFVIGGPLTSPSRLRRISLRAPTRKAKNPESQHERVHEVPRGV